MTYHNVAALPREDRQYLMWVDSANWERIVCINVDGIPTYLYETLGTGVDGMPIDARMAQDVLRRSLGRMS